MKTIECTQGSPEWHTARMGKVTASGMDQIISPTGKESTQAEKYMNKIIAEIVTGESCDIFKGNVHTERGKEWEQEAAEYYSMLRGVELTKVGFCVTDDGLVGCSPDRFIGDDGMLEIKTGLPHIMIEYALNDKLEQEHRPQTQSGLFVTDRQWVDTMLYHPLMKPIIIRSDRNDIYIKTMCGYLDGFHTRMKDKISLLRNKGYLENAA